MSLILSVCIPTYNRVKYLTSQLEELYTQIENHDLSSIVEVIVSNNASQDNTSKEVAKYIDLGLIYHEQSENIGPDANFFTLFDMAKGEYIWLLGDDDSFSGDVLEYIIKNVLEYRLDFLYLRTQGEISKDGNRSGEQVSNIEFFQRVLLNTTFMSSQIIRTSLVKANSDEAKNHFGDLMAYYYLFLTCLSSSESCMISCCREIYMKGDNTGGYKFYKVWGRGVLDVLTETRFGRDNYLLGMFKNEIMLGLIIPITFGFRSKTLNSDLGADSPQLYLKKHFGRGWRSWLFTCYWYLPVRVLRVINMIIRLVNKCRRTLNKTVY